MKEPPVIESFVVEMQGAVTNKFAEIMKRKINKAIEEEQAKSGDMGLTL